MGLDGPWLASSDQQCSIFAALHTWEFLKLVALAKSFMVGNKFSEQHLFQIHLEDKYKFLHMQRSLSDLTFTLLAFSRSHMQQQST